MTLAFIIICFTGCGLLLFAERRDLNVLRWISKITASSCFILIALTLADVSSAYANWMILGFIASFLGDILLIKNKSDRTFQLGIVSFGIAHGFFLVAFIIEGELGVRFAITSILALFLMIATQRWLQPKLESKFKILTLAYIVLIGGMVSLSGFAWQGSFRNGIIIGAVLFAMSDIFVAREKFIQSEFKNKLIGLPLYYLAQIFLALSLDW